MVSGRGTGAAGRFRAQKQPSGRQKRRAAVQQLDAPSKRVCSRQILRADDDNDDDDTNERDEASEKADDRSTDTGDFDDFNNVGRRVDSRLMRSEPSGNLVSSTSNDEQSHQFRHSSVSSTANSSVLSSVSSSATDSTIGVRISTRELTPQMGIALVTQLCIHRVSLRDVAVCPEKQKRIESLPYGGSFNEGRLDGSIRKNVFQFQYNLVDDGDKVISLLPHFSILYKLLCWLIFLGFDCDVKETALRIALGQELELDVHIPEGLDFLSPKMEIVFRRHPIWMKSQYTNPSNGALIYKDSPFDRTKEYIRRDMSDSFKSVLTSNPDPRLRWLTQRPELFSSFKVLCFLSS